MAGEITGLEGVAAAISNLSKVAPIAARRAMSRCGLIAVREAKANAPRSPTMKQLSATLKRKNAQNPRGGSQGLGSPREDWGTSKPQFWLRHEC